MSELVDELVKRTTITFPEPLKSDEIEDKFFGYLERNLLIGLRWSFTGFGYGSAPDTKRTRYLDKINVTITENEWPFTFATFAFQRVRELEDYFSSLRLDTPGCDDLRDLLSFPTGSEQFKLTEKIRQTTESYFAQRQK